MSEYLILLSTLCNGFCGSYSTTSRIP